jgi:hypothetical protein
VDPVPDQLLLRKSGSFRNRTRDHCVQPGTLTTTQQSPHRLYCKTGKVAFVLNLLNSMPRELMWELIYRFTYSGYRHKMVIGQLLAHWTGGWVGPRASLDDMEKWKRFILQEIEPRPLCRPARIQSLNRCAIAVLNLYFTERIYNKIAFQYNSYFYMNDSAV